MQSNIPSCRRCQRLALTISTKRAVSRRASTLRAASHDWYNTPSTSSSAPTSRHTPSFSQSFPPSTVKANANPIRLPSSRKEAHHLLYQLATSHRDVLLRDIQHTTAPALDRLVKLRHYAGAREILEAVFMQVNTSTEALSAKDINHLLLAILRVRNTKPSQAALTSLLRYIIRILVSHPDTYGVNTDTIRLLLSVPDYISPNQITDILALAKRNMDSDSALKHDVGILHSIMQVYARHRNFQMADMWMQAIQAAKELGYTASHKPSIDISTSRKRKGKARQEDLQTPDPDTMLATTYISSFASTSQSPIYANIDSIDAISFFNEVLHATATSEDHDTEKIAFEARMRKLDVHAWTSVMSAAAADTTNVDAESLLTVLSRLLLDETLPNPNIVTYTVVMQSLVSRDEAKLALLLFEKEILPLVRGGLLELDARALMAVTDAWRSLRRMDNGLRLLRYFGKQSTEAREQSILSKLSRPDGEDEENSLPLYTLHRYRSNKDKHASVEEFATLKHSVQLDTLILNNTLASLARSGRFKTVWLLYTVMEAVYGVIPDEATLAILGKTAISVEAWSKRRLHQSGPPLSTEDVYWPEDDMLDSDLPATGSTFSWKTKKPHVAVRRIFWNMLESNFPYTSLRAQKNTASAASRLFARFVGGADSSKEDDGKDMQAQQQTKALSEPSFHKESIPYPHLAPTASNMHIFIALLGYFGMASEIPMAMRYMKELDITPARRTLCLAMWTYEESGVYASHIRQFHTWLGNWLGDEAVPQDEEVGAFRTQQWDDPRLAPRYPD